MVKNDFLKTCKAVSGVVRKTMPVVMASTLVLSLGLTAVADEVSYDYYVVETNEDNTDPVYIHLDDSNSIETTEGRELIDDAKNPMKIYGEVLEVAQEVRTVYEIKSEETDVENLVVGESYSFIKGAGAKVGEAIESVPEGGATLEYLGEGKDSYVTGWPEDIEYVGTVEDIFAEDMQMISSVAYLGEAQKLAKAGDDFSSEASQVIGMKALLAYEAGGSTELSQISTLEQCYDLYVDLAYQWRGVEDYEKTKEEFIEIYGEELDEDFEDGLSQLPYLAQYICSMGEFNSEAYKEILSEMSTVDKDDKDAILQYLGMQESEVKYVKANMQDSNTPVRKNSGFVHVITPGAGFDNCKEGAIFYDSRLGWSYACTGGGVTFGEASDLHLFQIEEKTVDPGAFSILAGDAVQLDENGQGVAGLSNVKAYVTIDGVPSEIISFEFEDDYVDLNDCHVTAILGGKYYTVTLNLKKWAENPQPIIPVEEIVPVEEEPYVEPEPAPAPVVYHVSTSEFVEAPKAVNGTLEQGNGSTWYGYATTENFEKKAVTASEVTSYIDKCVAGGKDLITFTPSGMDTAGISNLGAALANVESKEKVTGLDFSSVTVGQNADLTNAFAGYTSLEIIDVSNWREFNNTFVQAGLPAGAGEKVFYYNDLTNQEYIDRLTELGWVGKHEDLDLSNWVNVDESFVQWAALVDKKTFTYNTFTAQAYIDYLTALGWTGIKVG